jgi:methionine-rich copper-binding protein CopC
MRRHPLALVLAGLFALAPVAARAHAILLESAPAAGATVAPGPLALRLRYNSRIDAARSRITLQRDGAAAEVLPIRPTDRPDLLAAGADLAAGTYVLRWQVLAVDGHITRGEVRFTVAPAP